MIISMRNKVHHSVNNDMVHTCEMPFGFDLVLISVEKLFLYADFQALLHADVGLDRDLWIQVT